MNPPPYPPYSYPPNPPGPPFQPPPPKKSNTGVVVLVASLVVVSLGLSIGTSLLKRSAKHDAKKAPPAELVNRAIASLAKMHAHFPDPTTLEEKACPADVTSGGFYAVHVADDDFLERFDSPEKIRTFRSSSEAPWDFSDDAVFQLAPLHGTDEHRDGAGIHGEVLALGRYVLVVRATEKNEPRMTADGKFVAGNYEGFAVLFDFETSTPICQAKIHAENSEVVSHRKKGIILGSTADEAVMDDLRKNIRSAASDGLTRIAPKLSTVGL